MKLKADVNHHGSLRERKKARTRASIREHALRLFREQGYSETTVEQIAAAAEVSPSTFFRYFPTKEDVVLRDDFDERMFEMFEEQPPSMPPVTALRVAIHEAIATLTPQEWAEFREATALGLSVPEIRARMLDEMTRTIARAAQALARRVGRSPEDMAVRVLAGAVYGAMLAVLGPEIYAEGKVGPELFDRVDEALAMLESGLPLLPRPRHPGRRPAVAVRLSPRSPFAEARARPDGWPIEPAIGGWMAHSSASAPRLGKAGMLTCHLALALLRTR